MSESSLITFYSLFLFKPDDDLDIGSKHVAAQKFDI